MTRRQRLSVRASTRLIWATYRAQARLLIPFAVVLFVPIGLVDALGERIDEAEAIDDAGVALLSAAALLQFAASMGGEQLYAGVAAATVVAARGGERHSLVDVARRIPYVRLVLADVLFTLGLAVALLLLVVPGVAFFTYFGLAAPLIEVERLRVTAAFRRSAELVRGSFWPVLLVLGGLYLLTNALTDLLQSGSLLALGHTLVADWAAAFAVGVALTPVAAVAAVVVALELGALHDRRAPSSAPATRRSP